MYGTYSYMHRVAQRLWYQASKGSKLNMTANFLFCSNQLTTNCILQGKKQLVSSKCNPSSIYVQYRNKYVWSIVVCTYIEFKITKPDTVKSV